MNIEGFHDLIVRAKRGDEAAFEKALSLVRPWLEIVAAQYRDPAMTAVDLVEIACYQAWRKIHTFKGGKNDEGTYKAFRAWMEKIVRNLGRNAVRDRERKRRHPDEKPKRLEDEPTPMSPGKTPSSICSGDERRWRIETTLASLPDQTAASIVRMHIMEEMSFTEISKDLDLDYEKVRARFNSAMRTLERSLRDLL
jgi:RNA polymerase sigma factor (sigma-70 family)